MGGQLSKIKGLFVRWRDTRVLILGLDAAGKTSILYKLNMKPNQDITTIPTVGFNVELVTYKNYRFNCWDVGGQDKIRPLWRHYYSGTTALIFVVDSTDTSRIDEARQELVRILEDPEMASAWLLVFANKQDLAGCMSEQEVTKRLRLEERKGLKWCVQASSAKDGRGLENGLKWLAMTYESNK